jgi:hypothetical protein
MPSSRRRTAATVVGLAAVIALAAGGGATAGVLITGKQIKDGTVTGVDLKNGSVKNVDIAGGYFSRSASDSRYLRRVNPPAAYAGSKSVGVLTGSLSKAASATFTAPSAGVAVVTVQAEFDAGTAGTWIDGALRQDGVAVQDWYWDAGDVTDGFWDLTQSRTLVQRVAKGSHTFDLYMRERNNAVIANYAEYRNAQVVVVFLPFAPSPVTVSSVDKPLSNN